MEKGLLIGSVIHKINRDDDEYHEYLVIDKVIVYGGGSSSTKYILVDRNGNVSDIHYDGIKKIVSFPSLSPSPSGFINSSTSKK
jgi:hypothetical protein